MENMLKISEVAARYDITARTLRYYEDVGLLASVRSEGYAYRMYSPEAIKRLEQILILRKLNIGVKDIIRVFASPDAGVLLEVLQRKATNIDEEVALLHELKGIILDFIVQIRAADFHKDEDVKLLYVRATEIEKQLTQEEEPDKPRPVERMAEIASRLEKLPDVRILSLPPCRMVSSGIDTGAFFAEGGKLDRFNKWFSEADKCRHDRFFPRDFMWYDPETRGTAWWYALEPGMPEPDGFETVDFEGGIYAAAVSRDGDDSDGLRVYQGIRQWVDQSGYFVPDERPGHYHMFHIIGTPEIGRAMGYSQLEIYVPLRVNVCPTLDRVRPAEEKQAIRKRINDAGTLFFDLQGDAAHMQKTRTPHYAMIRPRDGEQGPTALYDIRLEDLSDPEARDLTDRIKAMGVHVWWDICFPPKVKTWIFGERPLPEPEPNGEESYMAMTADEKPGYPALRPDISIRRVKTAQEFRQWADLTNTLFGEGMLFHPVHHFHLCQEGAMACYIAFMGDRAAGVCCMMRRDDLAALYLVATVPEMRRRGVATAACGVAIEEAVRSGAALLTACVWPAAKKLARKLGYTYY